MSQQEETLTVTTNSSPVVTYTVTVPAPIVTKVYDDMLLAAKAGNQTLSKDAIRAATVRGSGHGCRTPASVGYPGGRGGVAQW